MPANKGNSTHASPLSPAHRKTKWIDPDDIPELSDEMITNAVPHRGGTPVKRGRPPAAAPKRAVSIRLDADVLEHYRATGTGWQSRVNIVLRNAAKLGAKA